MPLRARKAWNEGEPLDFDSVDTATLNAQRWVITTRDAAGSSPPAAFRLVRTTPSYALWRRVGRVGPRSILAEGEMPGTVLDCASASGRSVLRGGGVAAVRPKPVVSTGAVLAPGERITVRLPLAPGKWRLQTSYLSRLPVAVSAPGLETTLPPNLERVGPRWPLGEVRVRSRRPTDVGFGIGHPQLAPNVPITQIDKVIATREAPTRVVPVRRACGRYVDWYRPAPDQG
jgi:hypothetical protein